MTVAPLKNVLKISVVTALVPSPLAVYAIREVASKPVNLLNLDGFAEASVAFVIFRNIVMGIELFVQKIFISRIEPCVQH